MRNCCCGRIGDLQCAGLNRARYEKGEKLSTGRALRTSLLGVIIVLLLVSTICVGVGLLYRPLENPASGRIPLVELPAISTSPYLAVFITGDGGWVTLDRRVSKAIASAGVPVVVINSLRYFWYRRTPEQAAEDLARVINNYF